MSPILAPAQPEPGGKRSQCPFEEVVNANGWEIPGAKKATIVSKRPFKREGIDGVIVETLSSKSPWAVQPLVRCVPGNSQRVEIQWTNIYVAEILRFSLRGRVFAYRVDAQIATAGEKARRSAAPSHFTITFYDEEGSGRFTVLQYPGPGILPRLDVPVWVRQVAAN
jgi:hypothetical protein